EWPGTRRGTACRAPTDGSPNIRTWNRLKSRVTSRLHGVPVARTARLPLSYHFDSAPPEDPVSSHQLAYAHKRRSTRVEKAVPLVVGGVGALREPYQEEVSTLSISCHGCTYQSRHEVI